MKVGTNVKVVVALVLVILTVVVVAVVCVKNPEIAHHISDMFSSSKSTTVTELDNSDVNIMIKEAILGCCSQEKQLVVYTREIYDTILLKESGLFGWDIFSKTKDIVFKGTAAYTVDLSEIDENDIVIDEDGTVTLYIPHAQLLNDNIIINSNDIIFEDTEKGALAFNDIDITPEQNAQLESSARQAMKNKLLEENDSDNADGFAKLSVLEIAEPLVSAISKDYNLRVDFKN